MSRAIDAAKHHMRIEPAPIVASSRDDKTLRPRPDACAQQCPDELLVVAGRLAFGDYFSAGVCFDSDLAPDVLGPARRFAASRFPMRLIAVHAATLLSRGRALPCSQL